MAELLTLLAVAIIGILLGPYLDRRHIRKLEQKAGAKKYNTSRAFAEMFFDDPESRVIAEKVHCGLTKASMFDTTRLTADDLLSAENAFALDSLASASFQMLLEEEFGIDLGNLWEKARTLRDVVNIVREKCREHDNKHAL